MKKQTFFVSLCAAVAFLASGCSQEIEQTTNENSGKTYVATVENTANMTRSYNAGNGAFVWSNGDDISAYDGSKFQTMTFKSGAGTGVATYGDVTFVPQTVAVFPTTAVKGYTDGTLTVNYPATIAQSTNSDDPMVAQFQKGQTTLNFKHVGGVIAFEINMPKGAENFIVTTDKAISGDFAVDMSGDAPIVSTNADAAGEKSVKFTFTKTTADGLMNFYLPVPTGEYESITIAAMDGTTVLKSVINSTKNTISRCDWTKFTINLCTYTGTIEQTVTGVANLASLIANMSAEELAKKDLTIDLNGETLTNTTDTKKITSISTNNLTIENGTVDATGLNLKATNSITLKDVKLTGAFPKSNSNARISINTPGKVVIDGVDFTGTTDGYNAIEINLNSSPITSDVEIKNCKFGDKLTNNSILIFGLPEGGVANIENCDFVLSNTSNALRISNKFNANTFTVNIKDCSYKYADTSYTGGVYTGFLLFQDYTSKTKDEANSNKQFSGLKINCNNVTYNGTKVTSVGIGTTKPETQFAYVYYDKVGVVTDDSHFPTFTFE